MVQRLQNFYEEKVVPQLMEQFTYKNKHQVPTVKKIVINRGLGDASQNAKLLESCSKELSVITGQQGVVTRSKKAIAGF
jgi:large subunit ribosomal protein L5